ERTAIDLHGDQPPAEKSGLSVDRHRGFVKDLGSLSNNRFARKTDAVYRGEMSPIDQLGRPLRRLRISVTDRCNLRCQYCMPEEEYVCLRRDQLISFEEIAQLAGLFAALAVQKFRLTGGEPLVRRDLPRLVKLLSADPRIRDLALTTN